MKILNQIADVLMNKCIIVTYSSNPGMLTGQYENAWNVCTKSLPLEMLSKNTQINDILEQCLFW